jgi:hypothetical protein
MLVAGNPKFVIFALVNCANWLGQLNAEFAFSEQKLSPKIAILRKCI